MKLSIIYILGLHKGNSDKKKFKERTRKLINTIQKSESKKIDSINIVFCNDELMKEYNFRYLNHNYETDIITFHNVNDAGNIEGELLISGETVESNSGRYKTTFEEELFRVIIHGILHLTGYDDKTASQKRMMRKKENQYLNLLNL